MGYINCNLDTRFSSNFTCKIAIYELQDPFLQLWVINQSLHVGDWFRLQTG